MSPGTERTAHETQLDALATKLRDLEALVPADLREAGWDAAEVLRYAASDSGRPTMHCGGECDAPTVHVAAFVCCTCETYCYPFGPPSRDHTGPDPGSHGIYREAYVAYQDWAVALVPNLATDQKRRSAIGGLVVERNAAVRRLADVPGMSPGDAPAEDESSADAHRSEGHSAGERERARIFALVDASPHLVSSPGHECRRLQEFKDAVNALSAGVMVGPEPHRSGKAEATLADEWLHADRPEGDL